MIKRIYKYYTGILESQFELTNIDIPTIKSIGGQHNIQLQPKFRLFEFQEITKVDFESTAARIEEGKHLKYNSPSQERITIDLIPNSQQNIHAKPIENAFLMFENESPNRVSEKQNIPLQEKKSLWDTTITSKDSIKNYKFSLPLTPYLVNSKDHKHGRLHATAVISTYEEITVPDPEPTRIETVDEKLCDYIDKDSLVQCQNKVPKNTSFCPHHSNLISNPSTDGCFGDGCFGGRGSTKRLWDRYLLPLGLDYTNSRGCFRGRNLNPTGCFSSSVPTQSRLGCGISSLLGLLALLWLLGCLLFGNCSGCNKQTNTGISKTDTVYVEVFRELKDTLKVVKNFVDSTTTNNYEMVSLPNVQFFTDSDKLLPSSAKELQTLAEYLIKNDSLQATIFGHTDNTGDPKANLDLSQRRAESVKNFLVNIGVKESNLFAVGKGDTQPKAPNTTKEGRLMNRRVEVILKQSQLSSTKRVELPDTTNSLIR
ncbi:MAG: OmpA family protein [Bacteroidota bacterium]